MGWWPLHIGTGGINWGQSKEENTLINVQPGSSPLPSDELVWGDGPADIVDTWIDEHLKELWDECNKEFVEYMGREMTPLEFINGLAFGFRACDPDFEEEGIPSCYTHELSVKVIESFNDSTDE
jgi:hypothetical protein